ncbi:MAG TPA: electron transfer flavoprotein subunit alpha/FixB family protein [Longimicrobiales bacterium]|jgi:electron transfer flavoprotein alpha subunit
MGDVLAFIEQRDGSPRGVALETATVASRLAESMGSVAHGVAVGGPGLAEALGGMGGYGLHRVGVAEHPSLAPYAAEAYARIVAGVARDGGYGAVVFSATALGKDLAPRVAVRLDVPLATDVTEVEVEGGALRLRRPVYSGKAFARITLDATPAVFSIRPNVFQPRERPAAGTVESVAVEIAAEDGKSRTLRFEASGGGHLDVTEATTVVSGGRGMKGPENWGLLEGLRDALGDGTALGASRAVVDAGWRPHGEQVGQTGKTVSPKLYFAIGISGAIQHLAGMRTAQTIVAVNKDPDAPIFNVADYGIVGDLFEVVPRLTEAVKALRVD